MRALVCSEPKKFAYQTIGQPVPQPNHAIIKIRRIGVCGTDLHAYEGTQPFLSYPRILGHELAGELVSADNAPGFRSGEIVSLIPYFSCRACVACRTGKPNCCTSIKVCGVHIDGGMTEYLSVPSNSLLHSDGLSLDAMALVEPLAIGAHGVRRAAVKPGEFVLVVGAGPIGIGTMEFARIAGAKVIALDINQQRLDFCRDKLKVDYAINASRTDVIDLLREITSGDMPSVVIDATGSIKAINNAFQYMTHGGRYVLIGLQRENISFSHPEFHKREGTLMSSRNATRLDFEHVIDSLKKNLVKPETYITHRSAFGEVMKYFESWLNPGTGVIKAMIEIA
ncbi:MAG TPA: zinc-binding alcohol dehydrogenase family protein [Chryseosolibacter sp.]